MAGEHRERHREGEQDGQQYRKFQLEGYRVARSDLISHVGLRVQWGQY
jgi:hypothetical protein